MKKILTLPLLVLLALPVVSFTQHSVGAVSASDWQAGNIASDIMFTNSNDMSVSDIQAFLNSKVANCDTNGTQPASEYGRPDLTHAQYAAQRGWRAPPYVCLKNYYEVPKYTPGPGIPANNFSGSVPPGAISAAQIIYDAARSNNLNPKVILVKIATESSGPLTSDTWPMESQYTYAMGSHCPDSGPNGSANCDANYAGFSMQVQSGAELMRWYLDSMSQPWWSYKKPFQTNNILWNVVERGCGGSNVYISSRATAALYTYTPYQPNAAALNNMYGTGDSCSAYGNRNFWRVWNDWFGSTQSEPDVLSFKSHLSGMGWTNQIRNRGVSGTVGDGRPMEAFRINGNVDYSSYSYETGWQPTVNNGVISGTTTIGRPIQAIKLNLNGTFSSQYDLWYRTHIGGIGWMGWVKNGDPSGVSGSSTNNIEAFEIQLLPKNSGAPGVTTDTYRNLGTAAYNPVLSLKATAHVGYVGWQPELSNDMTIGVTEQDKRIEAIKLSLTNTTGLSGNIVYSAHASNIGWQPFVSSGSIAGTVGESRQVEAVRIALTGALADNYDIVYRGFIRYSGWQGWAKNGDPAGSIGVGRHLEGLEVHIFPKSAGASDSTALYNPGSETYPETYSLSYNVHSSTIGWLGDVSQNQTGGTTGRGIPIEAIQFKPVSSVLSLNGDISCSVYSKDYPWTNAVSQGNLCGTTGQAKTVQAIKLSLTGDIANKYDISYRAHVSGIGWMNWVKNGAAAGVVDNGKTIEAIEVKLTRK